MKKNSSHKKKKKNSARISKRNSKNEESRSKTHTRTEQGIPTIPFVLLPVIQQ